MNTAQQIDKAIADWLYRDATGHITVNGIEVRLEYTDSKKPYAAWVNGKIVAWNDNHKDFRDVGALLLKIVK